MLIGRTIVAALAVLAAKEVALAVIAWRRRAALVKAAAAAWQERPGRAGETPRSPSDEPSRSQGAATGLIVFIGLLAPFAAAFLGAPTEVAAWPLVRERASVGAASQKATGCCPPDARLQAVGGSEGGRPDIRERHGASQGGGARGA